MLPNTQLYIMNDDGETLKYLPLQPTTTSPVKETEETTEPTAEASEGSDKQ